MILVRRIHDVLVFQIWIATLENTDDIRSSHALHFALEIQFAFDSEFDWLEISRRGFGAQGVEILSGEFHQTARRIVSHPRTKL